MVILNSNEAITDLIEKRSGIYADKVRDKSSSPSTPDTKAAPDAHAEAVSLKWHLRRLLS